MNTIKSLQQICESYADAVFEAEIAVNSNVITEDNYAATINMCRSIIASSISEHLYHAIAYTVIDMCTHYTAVDFSEQYQKRIAERIWIDYIGISS